MSDTPDTSYTPDNGLPPPAPMPEDTSIPEVGQEEEINSSLAPPDVGLEVIVLAKSYKILTDKMDSNRTPFGGRIIFVCFALCNLRLNIVPNHC